MCMWKGIELSVFIIKFFEDVVDGIRVVVVVYGDVEFVGVCVGYGEYKCIVIILEEWKEESCGFVGRDGRSEVDGVNGGVD